MASIALSRGLLASLSKMESREKSQTIEFLRKLETEHVRQGTRLERLNRARLPNLWSARINRDLRAILYREGETWLVLHAAHHDDAYAWAERRQLHHDEASQRLQIVEVHETAVEVEVEVPVHVEPPVFAIHDDDYLLSLGVPPDWLLVLREIRSQDQLLALCDSLPEELVEALIDVASGELVTPPPPIAQPTVFHPAAQRRYVVLHDEVDLGEVLERSLEEWMLFLHPAQRQLVEGVFRGPCQVTGAAGTGKTVVALHRARELADRGAQVLLVTFTRALAASLSAHLDRLCSESGRSRIEVSTLHSQALRLAQGKRRGLKPLTEQQETALLQEAVAGANGTIEVDRLLSEWRGVIRATGVLRWDEYRDLPRVGRGEGLTVDERFEIWQLIESARKASWQQGRLDWPGICGVATRALEEGDVTSPFQAVLVDELQDLGMAELRLVKALSAGAPGNLMLFGDARQRIYASHSNVTQAGINVASRVFTLRTNYRTTEAISRTAEALLGSPSAGERRCRSLLRGPEPTFHRCGSLEEERDLLLKRLDRWLSQGLLPDEIAVLARVDDRLSELRKALAARGQATCGLQAAVDGAVRLGTMHSAKGLEFKAVALAGCDDDTVPLARAVRSHTDPSDREAQLLRERHLLYVSVTRARDDLVVTWVGSPSRWIRDSSAEALPARTPS